MAFVVSEGQIRGLGRAPALRSDYVKLADDYTADYAAVWAAQGALRTTVDFLGRNIASLGLHLFERVSDTDRARVTKHPLASLLGAPNPHTTRYRLMDSLVRDMGIYDRAYWLKLKGGGPAARQLVRLPPAKVRAIGKNWMYPEGFEFSGGRGKKTFTPDQVVFFRGYSPDGDHSGVSPIESLRRVLAEEYEAGRMREQILRNGARASGYLERPVGSPKWSTEAADRFRAGWRAQYTGGGPEAGGTPILEDGMKFVSASQTSKELQYVETRKLTREEVAAAYFIPPTMVGVMDSATFSNIREQHKHLYQDTLGPWLTMIAEELMLQLLPEFGDTSGLYLEFNLGEKLRGSFEEQASQLQAATGGPWMTRNEARARNNMPSVDGGDELIVPLNVLTGGQASPQDSAPPPVAGGSAAGPGRAVKSGGVKSPEPTDAQREAGVALYTDFFRRQRRSVLPLLGAGKGRGVASKAGGPDWWDGERWDRELADDLYALAVSVSGDLGPAAAAALGFDPGDYDKGRTLAFLRAVAESRAGMVNAATLAQLEEVLADESDDGPTPESVFDLAEAQRSGSAGMAIVTAVGAFALVEAGKQVAGSKAVKTWVVTSKHPRASHARMAGESVPVGAVFSNGMAWPGDPVGGVDEVAGCQCTVSVSVE